MLKLHLSSENALTKLSVIDHHWVALLCILLWYIAWYIFTSTFLTIPTHEFPLNFHPSRAAPRSCVATNRVVLEASSPPPRPEWFYMHGSASCSVHSESIIQPWSCCPTFPALVMAHLWRNASYVRAGWEVEVVTLVPATGTQHRDPDRDQDSRQPRHSHSQRYGHQAGAGQWPNYSLGTVMLLQTTAGSVRSSWYYTYTTEHDVYCPVCMCNAILPMCDKRNTPLNVDIFRIFKWWWQQTLVFINKDSFGEDV